MFNCAEFQGYDLLKWSEQINHLSYADDTIIYVKVDNTTLKLLMETLTDYEEQFG